MGILLAYGPGEGRGIARGLSATRDLGRGKREPMTRLRRQPPSPVAGTMVALLVAMVLAADAAHGQTPPPPAVVVEPVGEQRVGMTAEFLARVETIEAVDIRARVQGVLEEVAFSAGQHVEAGDVLFRIQREQFEAEMASARAQVARAEASLTEARDTLARTRELRERGTVPQATLDAAVAAHAMAQADVAAASAAIRSSEIHLGYTEIRAPIAGRVGRPLATRGNVVGPESGPLARIVQLDPVWVAFSLSEREVVNWRQAQLRGESGTDVSRFNFSVRLPNGTEHPATGTLDFIESEVDASTGTIAVRAIFPNPGNLLAPGQNVTLRAAEGDPPIFPVVRQSAVLQDRQGRYVYLLGENDIVARRDIETGARVAEGWAVEGGLEVGEPVVIQGVQRLRPGMQVRPTPAQGPGS
jgi:membrane fusion protein, multidrug efflux system